MKLTFKKATLEDLDLLVSSRMEVLKDLGECSGEENPPCEAIEEQTRHYFARTLGKEYIGYFVYKGEEYIGCGGISFFQSLPTPKNPQGMQAVIVNMYTRPEHRGQGIAYQLLDVLVQEAVLRSVGIITLEATPKGISLYKRYGFESSQEEMYLPYRLQREHLEKAKEPTDK